jgi:Ni,Fe-hydrogenase maturation factor
MLLGIQPARAQMGAEISEPIKDAIEKVNEALLKELSSL